MKSFPAVAVAERKMGARVGAALGIAGLALNPLAVAYFLPQGAWLGAARFACKAALDAMRTLVAAAIESAAPFGASLARKAVSLMSIAMGPEVLIAPPAPELTRNS